MALGFLERIGPQHSQWLRGLTICIPVMREQVCFFERHYSGVTAGFGARTTDWHWHRLLYRGDKALTYTALTQLLFHHLESLPRLEELYFVFPQLWQQVHVTVNLDTSEWKDTLFHPEHQAIWSMFEDYVRNKPRGQSFGIEYCLFAGRCLL
jgi:hypothetical protein